MKEVIDVIQAHTQYNQAISEKALSVLEDQIKWYQQSIRTNQAIICGLIEFLEAGPIGPSALDRAYYWAQSVGCYRDSDGVWRAKEGTNAAPSPAGDLPTPISGDAKLEADG